MSKNSKVSYLKASISSANELLASAKACGDLICEIQCHYKIASLIAELKKLQRSKHGKRSGFMRRYKDGKKLGKR